MFKKKERAVLQKKYVPVTLFYMTQNASLLFKRRGYKSDFRIQKQFSKKNFNIYKNPKHLFLPVAYLDIFL